MMMFGLFIGYMVIGFVSATLAAYEDVKDTLEPPTLLIAWFLWPVLLMLVIPTCLGKWLRKLFGRASEPPQAPSGTPAGT